MTASPDRRLERIEGLVSPPKASPTFDLDVPNIIDFVVRSEYLGRPKLSALERMANDGPTTDSANGEEK